MKDWNWTPRARLIGNVIAAIGILAIGWILFVGTWYALGGK
jgi:hypothetical protein